MMDLDQAIDQSYEEASGAEASARYLEVKIEQIPGRKGLPLGRKCGVTVNLN